MKKRLEEFMVQKKTLGEQVEVYLKDKSQPLLERMEVYNLMTDNELGIFSKDKEYEIWAEIFKEMC